jgi:hypothetical protein
MNLDEVLQRLKSARRSGKSWMARCPAHGDKSPSLSVRDENGKVLFHCFAGCSVDAICTALGIKVSDLFARRTEVHRPPPRIVSQAQRQLTGLRSRLTPRDRDRAIAVVLAQHVSLDAAIARALALAVEGELVQVAFDEGAQ